MIKYSKKQINKIVKKIKLSPSDCKIFYKGYRLLDSIKGYSYNKIDDGITLNNDNVPKLVHKQAIINYLNESVKSGFIKKWEKVNQDKDDLKFFIEFNK